MQPSDVPASYADIDDLARSVDSGTRRRSRMAIRQLAVWYRSYHYLVASIG
jgi:UDP-glucuronate 4-epimerase